MSKDIFYVGVKIHYAQVAEEKLFKKPAEERVWCVYDEKAILAYSEDEAIEKYKDRYPSITFGLIESVKTSDNFNFDWLCCHTRLDVDEEYVILNSTHSIDWLMKNMDCQEFKEWFFDDTKQIERENNNDI